LRFASGDEDIRSVLYDSFGDALFSNFAKVAEALEKRLSEWGSDDADEEDENGGSKKKGLAEKKKKKLLDADTWARDARLIETARTLREAIGEKLFEDHNIFRERLDAALKAESIKIEAADKKLILRAVSWRVETAAPVILKSHNPAKAKADPLRGLYEATVDGKPAIIEYEPDSELRDAEQVPLLEEGGIEAFIRREVLPYTRDAWIKEGATKIGYEVSFTRHFYEPRALRTLDEIRTDIVAAEREAEGLLDDLLKVAAE
jgi:type I restriction enzyme M protein